MANGTTFKADISSWVSRVGDQMDALARQVCQETAQRVVEATPVDTGFLRGSWQPSIGSAPSRSEGGADIGLVLSGMRAGDTFWMTNNAVYAMRVEFGFVGEDSLGRYYDQKGQFFVSNTVAKYEEIVAAVARDLRIT